MKDSQQNTDALVIIPTYNEKENISLLIPAIFALEKNFHLLIVDDASPDGTAGVVEELKKTYPGRLYLRRRVEKLGLGTAYKEGFHFALQRRYQYILTMDADFSHAPEDLIRLYNECDQGTQDYVIGSRYLVGINVAHWSLHRVLLSYGANALVRCITGMPFQDTTAGFQCYQRKVLATIDLEAIRSVGYAFQVELKFLAWKYGFQGSEIPIVFSSRVRGESKMSQSILLEALMRVPQMKVASFFKTYHPHSS
ncbi:MAG: polyprenol monophosphomannose synthase [Bacteroidota bacterium]